jgi:hypothetical protein
LKVCVVGELGFGAENSPGTASGSSRTAKALLSREERNPQVRHTRDHVPNITKAQFTLSSEDKLTYQIKLTQIEP